MPGLHHVLARSFKDLVCRWKTMEGRVVVRRAGWDCHGLPVEREVEKALGLNSRPEVEEFGVERFNGLCVESVWRFGGEWEKLTERMGYWVDMKNRYATLDQEYMESEWWALKQLWNKNMLKRAYKVLPYSPHTGCTYSNRDVQEGYKEVTDLACFVRFPLLSDANEDDGTFPLATVVAWTSTPWTLPANVLLAVDENAMYAVVQVASVEPMHGKDESGSTGKRNPDCFQLGLSYFRGDELLMVSRSSLSELKALLPSDDYKFEVLREVQGMELVGRRYLPPFRDEFEVENLSHDDQLWRVVHGDFVKDGPVAGTGVVHVAPMYGEDDRTLCVNLGLDLNRRECQHVVGLDGCYLGGGDNDDHKQETFLLPPPLRGLDVTNAQTQEVVLRLLHSNGLLYRAHYVTHKYPHCWRNESNRLLYYAMDSWNVTMGEPSVRERMQELNGLPEVRFAPESLKQGRFGTWLQEAKDWCLSRKRSWGCPLPVWECKGDKGGCGKLHCVGSRAELQSLLVCPTTVLDEKVDLHATQVDALQLRCPECGNENGSMCREPYVLDCWFDSGCAPFAQWHYPFAFASGAKDPVGTGTFQYTAKDHYNGSADSAVDFVAEGSDQCRGWFYSLLAVSSTLFDRPAYKHCLALGLVLDKDGVKMSKSKGNSVDPWKHFNEEGADALRWYLLGMCSPWADRRFDKKLVRAANQKFFCVLHNVTKWWHLRWEETKDEACKATQAGPRGVLDRWMLSRLAALVRTCNESFQGDNFHFAVASLEYFVNEDLSKTYLRLSRSHFRRVACGDGGGSGSFAPLQDRLTCLYTMRDVLLVVCRLVAPMSPFLVDRLHRCLMNSQTCAADTSPHVADTDVGVSVHLASWPTVAETESFLDTAAEDEVKLLKSLLQAGHTVHDKGTRPGRLPLARAYCAAYEDLEATSTSCKNQVLLSEEAANLLGFELNVLEVCTLKNREEFDVLMNRVQVQSLAPNVPGLESRFKAETAQVVQALRETLGESVAPSVSSRSVLMDKDATFSDAGQAENPCDPNSLNKKSNKQLKRVMKLEAKRKKKEEAMRLAEMERTKLSGPRVDDALLQLRAHGELHVSTGRGQSYTLFASDLHVSHVSRPGFAVSVQSLMMNAGDVEDGAHASSQCSSVVGPPARRDFTTGVVFDLGVNPALVSRYLAKEVTHFVQGLRKRLNKKHFREGGGSLRQVTLQVVVHPNAQKKDDRSNKETYLFSADWTVLLQDTKAECTTSTLVQSPDGNLLSECQEKVIAGSMEHLLVRSYGSCSGFHVFVGCARSKAQAGSG